MWAEAAEAGVDDDYKGRNAGTGLGTGSCRESPGDAGCKMQEFLGERLACS